MRALLFIALTLSFRPSISAQDHPLTNSDVVRAVERGYSIDEIVPWIKTASVVEFRISPEYTPQLEKLGVPKQIIEAMIRRVTDYESRSDSPLKSVTPIPLPAHPVISAPGSPTMNTYPVISGMDQPLTQQTTVHGASAPATRSESVSQSAEIRATTAAVVIPISNTTRIVPMSCGAAWPVTLQALIRVGFVPLSSDKGGGVLSIRWTKGQSGGAAANHDVRSLTNASHGAITTFDRFRVDDSSVLFTTEHDGACRIQITLALSAWKSSVLQKGWVAVESNGVLESRLLDQIQSGLPK